MHVVGAGHARETLERLYSVGAAFSRDNKKARESNLCMVDFSG